MSRRLETTVNIAILVAALLFIGLLVQRLFFDSSSSGSGSNNYGRPQIGQNVKVDPVYFHQGTRTLFLALQSTCSYCTQSAPFYRRLLEESRGKDIKLIAVLPDSAEQGTKYLNDLGINNLTVVSSPISVVGAGGTPTLVLTDDKGQVTNFWVGKLSPDKEAEVINRLKS